MIDMLGVGVPLADGWLLHRVCARVYDGSLVAVCSPHRGERTALLGAVSGRVIPAEGRVWINGVAVAKGRGGRLRELVGEVEPVTGLVPHRSALWNVLADRTSLGGIRNLWRFPRARDRRAALRAMATAGLEGRSRESVANLALPARLRLAVARALWRNPKFLVIPEVESWLDGSAAAELLTLVRGLVRSERLGALVSGAPTESLLAAADRVLFLSGGLLVFDGAPADLAGSRAFRASAATARS